MHEGENLLEMDPNGSVYKFGVSLAHFLWNPTELKSKLICESKRQKSHLDENSRKPFENQQDLIKIREIKCKYFIKYSI